MTVPLGPEGHLVRLHVNPNAANLSSHVGALLALSDEFAQPGAPTLTTRASSAAPTIKEGASVNKSKLRKCDRGGLLRLGPMPQKQSGLQQ